MTGLDSIFVYGTLRKGYENPHARRLRSEAVWLGHGTMPGELYLRTATPFPYPAAVFLPEAETLVHGELFSLGGNADLLRQLDHYEGVGPGYPEPQEYVRSVVTVTLEGCPRQAWCYVANLPMLPENRIPGGDFTQVVPPPNT